MVYCGEQSRHAQRPLYVELVRALRAAGAAGATALRGIWGYHGDHAPHGDSFWQLRRRVPVVTVIVDTPERIAPLVRRSSTSSPTRPAWSPASRFPPLRAAGPGIARGGPAARRPGSTLRTWRTSTRTATPTTSPRPGGRRRPPLARGRAGRHRHLHGRRGRRRHPGRLAGPALRRGAHAHRRGRDRASRSTRPGWPRARPRGASPSASGAPRSSRPRPTARRCSCWPASSRSRRSGACGRSPDVDGGFVLVVGLLGACVNVAAAMALGKAERRSLNVEGARAARAHRPLRVARRRDRPAPSCSSPASIAPTPSPRCWWPR